MTSAPNPLDSLLSPCPFCGGPVRLERARNTYDPLVGTRKWWGVICRNTTNRGGTCAIEQAPSASPEAAIDRWNLRAQPNEALVLALIKAALAMFANGHRHNVGTGSVFIVSSDAADLLEQTTKAYAARPSIPASPAAPTPTEPACPRN
jgi:hypothetical protein